MLNPEAKTAIARLKSKKKIIGGGFLIQGGYLLTCAHVIRDVLGLRKGDSPLGLEPGVCPIGMEVILNFVYPRISQPKKAEVLLYKYKQNEDEPYEDIAGLRLLDPLPKDINPVKFLMKYEFEHSYTVIGFPTGHEQGLVSKGELVEELPCGWIQLEDTKNQGLPILGGFSGSPVWCQLTSGCLGMAVAYEKNHPDAKIGFMIPAHQLSPLSQNLELLDIFKDYV